MTTINKNSENIPTIDDVLTDGTSNMFQHRGITAGAIRRNTSNYCVGFGFANPAEWDSLNDGTLHDIEIIKQVVIGLKIDWQIVYDNKINGYRYMFLKRDLEKTYKKATMIIDMWRDLES